MEKMIEQANPSVERVRWNQRSIYRVPEFIKKMTRSDAYRPQFVSLGPYHHGEPHLLAMEEHKRRALVHLVKRAGKPLAEFVAAIEQVVDELQAAYGDLDDKWRGTNRSSFVEMMVTDGCFLLESIRMASIILLTDEIDDDYAANDPIFSKRSFLTLWLTMRNDMIAMENQLPLVVLERLFAVQCGRPPVRTLYLVRNMNLCSCYAMCHSKQQFFVPFNIRDSWIKIQQNSLFYVARALLYIRSVFSIERWGGQLFCATSSGVQPPRGRHGKQPGPPLP
jgi:hypothetical protein